MVVLILYILSPIGLFAIATSAVARRRPSDWLVTPAGSFFNAATIGELITPSPQRGRRPAWPPSGRYCAQSVIAINYRIICPGPRRYRWAPPSDDDAGHNV
jgi:hypothetical protein